MSTTVRTRLAAALLVPLAAVAFSACGSSPDTGLGTIEPVSAPVTTPAPLNVPTGDIGVPTAGVVSSDTVAARLLGPTDVHAEPADDSSVVTSLSQKTELGSPTTLLVVGQEGDWIEVALPIRPNGSTGWIPAEAAELRTNDYVITVDLDQRTLTLSQDEAIVLQTPVAVGSDANPTPPGRYFVTDLVATGDEAGAYGPFAFGLSGHSETLSEFGGGDGQLGIHGTNDPSSIGNNVSHGCVRVPNDTIAQMIDLVPLGTPVTVV